MWVNKTSTHKPIAIKGVSFMNISFFDPQSLSQWHNGSVSASGAEGPRFKSLPNLWVNCFLLLGFQTMLFPNPNSIRIDAAKVPSMFSEVLFTLASAHCDIKKNLLNFSLQVQAWI